MTGWRPNRESKFSLFTHRIDHEEGRLKAKKRDARDFRDSGNEAPKIGKRIELFFKDDMYRLTQICVDAF